MSQLWMVMGWGCLALVLLFISFIAGGYVVERATAKLCSKTGAVGATGMYL